MHYRNLRESIHYIISTINEDSISESTFIPEAEEYYYESEESDKTKSDKCEESDYTSNTDEFYEEDDDYFPPYNHNELDEEYSTLLVTVWQKKLVCRVLLCALVHPSGSK